MSPKAEQAHAQLTAEVDPGLPVMMLDGDQIKQLLVNLVQNGLDAVAQDGQIAIGVKLREGGQAVEIRVSDNGCGIPEEHRAKLFTPFFTTKEASKGTGLGLAIAYGVVKMHSGDISVASEEGKGTVFTVSLPLEPAPENEHEQKGGSSPT